MFTEPSSREDRGSDSYRDLGGNTIGRDELAELRAHLEGLEELSPTSEPETNVNAAPEPPERPYREVASNMATSLGEQADARKAGDLVRLKAARERIVELRQELGSDS